MSFKRSQHFCKWAVESKSKLSEQNFTDIYCTLLVFWLYCTVYSSPKRLLKFLSRTYHTYWMKHLKTGASTTQFCPCFNDECTRPTKYTTYLHLIPMLLTHTTSIKLYYWEELYNWNWEHYLFYSMWCLLLPNLFSNNSIQAIWLFSWSLNHTTLTRLLLLGSMGIFVHVHMCVSDLLSWSCEWRKLECFKGRQTENESRKEFKAKRAGNCIVLTREALDGFNVPIKRIWKIIFLRAFNVECL